MLEKLYNKISNLNLNGRQFFAIFAAYFIILGLLSVILAMAGIFYAVILEIYLILGGITLIYLFIRNIKTIRFEKSFYIILAVSILAIALFSYYSTPTIFSGRDEGSLSEAAIRLSNNHELKFSFPASQEFFNIYGKGKALNFPGFDYASGGELITHFPLGYISWLAVLFSIFGLKGLIIANGISFLFFILSFYFLAREMMEKKSAFLLFLLTISSFVFFWFFKFTLSENLALMLVWFGIWQFFLFIKNRRQLELMLALLSLGSMLFVRIEGFAFLLMAILFLFWYSRKEKTGIREKVGKNAFFLLSAIIVLYIISLYLDRAFYIGFAKNLLRPFVQSSAASSNESFFTESLYAFRVLSAYAVLNYLVFGLLGAVYLLKSKKIKYLLPLFIVLPSFIYLIDPQISNDHPWMLRRYIFSIIPATLLYSGFFLGKFIKNRFLFWAFGGILIITNLLVTIPFIAFKPNDNLLPQVEKLSQNFTENDLILIDREATGDAHSMMSGPLNFIFNKQSVYFFNPDDLDKIYKQNFSKIYLIVPDKNLELYESHGLLPRMIPIKTYSINLDVLDVAVNPDIDYNTQVKFPKNETLKTYGKIYLLKK